MPSKPLRRTVEVGLGLDVGTEPIRGHVHDVRGTALPFTGWLELIQLLDQIRSGSSADACESDQAPYVGEEHQRG